MERFYVFKDGTQQGSTATREQAISMIRQYQAVENHLTIKSEYSIICGEEEFIPYEIKPARHETSISEAQANSHDFAEKFYREVFGDDFKDIELPPDCYETVLDVMARYLTEREQKVLEMALGEGLSNVAVGAKFSVTRERIYQIKTKAFRKLRRPDSLWRLKLGNAGCENMEKQRELERELKIERHYQAQVAALKAYGPALENNLQIDVSKIIAQNDIAKINRALEILDLTIVEMDLSVRAYNALRRANIKTLGQLVGMDTEALMRVRNLGKKTLPEVIQRRQQLLECLKTREETNVPEQVATVQEQPVQEAQTTPRSLDERIAQAQIKLQQEAPAQPRQQTRNRSSGIEQ